MSGLAIELAALTVSVLALGLKIHSSLRARSWTIRRFKEEGAEIEIRQRLQLYLGQDSYDFNIINHGRMPATVRMIGAMAIDEDGVFTKLTIEPPDFYPYVLESYDNVALSIPYDALFKLHEMLPDGVVRTFVMTSHSFDLGPEVPL